MKRRDLFGAGALGLTLSSSSCASSRSGRHASDVAAAMPDDFALTLERIDRSLWFLDHPRSIPTIFRDVPAVRDDADAASLARDGLKSLLMVGFFRDVPEEARGAPEVQRRMWQAAPTFEASVRGMAAFLARLTPEALARVRDRLRVEPELPARVASTLEAALDNEWVEDPLSTLRHIHLRSLVAEIVFRLKHQPVSLVVDDVVRRMARAGGFADQDAATREVLRAAEGGDVRLVHVRGPCRDKRDCRDGDECTGGRCVEGRERFDPTKPTLVGLAAFGLGIVVLGGSILLLPVVGFPIIFGATLGALIILIGIIILFVTGALSDADVARGG